MRPARPILVGLALAGVATGGCAVWRASQPTCAPPPSQAAQPASAPATHAGDEYRPYIYGGLPKTSQHLTLLKNKGYLAGYSEKHKDPARVAYRLFKVDDPQTHPRLSRFIAGDRTQAKVAHGVYTSSGYDRGHMAPNYAIDVCYGEDAQAPVDSQGYTQHGFRCGGRCTLGERPKWRSRHRD
jgi:DNA/RNA endonuclease G (NUC1)